MAYIFALAALLLLDFSWLSLTAEIYRGMLSHLFASSFSILPALAFYPLYALAMYVLILVPAIREKDKLVNVTLTGALLGLAAYGAYDLTNQATLRDWPLMITVMDMAWGACVTAASSGIAYALYNRIKK